MTTEPLFPQFERFAKEAGLDRAKGSLSAVTPRILGLGKTKATDLEEAPAPIERKSELAGLKLPHEFTAPPEVQAEMDAAAAEVKALRQELARPDGRRRFIADCLPLLPGAQLSDGMYHVGNLILVEAKGGFEWAWCLTVHYPLVQRLPPDPEYIAKGLVRAQAIATEIVLPVDVFEKRLLLAWQIARHWCGRDDVPVADVMKYYQVAAQDDRFWGAPRRAAYRDIPDAAFVANIINWRNHGRPADSGFSFVPASLHQATGQKVFYMPANTSGTEVRPIVYLRRAPGAMEVK
jgi:hypothetical protein